MSMALKVSRARAGTGPPINRAAFRGDPGLLGDIFGTVTGFIRDPIGTALDLGTKLLGGGEPVPKPIAIATNQTISSGFQERFPGEIFPGVDIDIFGAGQEGASIDLFAGSAAEQATRAAQVNGKCAPGFHLNRATYFLKNGTRIAKGSRCVRDRRMNPLNPRAASKAIKRIGRAKAATDSLDRVSIKCKRCRKVTCECHGMRKLC